MDNILETKKLINGLKGEITIPPDKSISHRALIFGALTNSKIKIKNLSKGEDCISTLKILEKLGVEYEFISEHDLILNSSKGLSAKEKVILNCNNSGTSARLLAGLFSRCDFSCVLIGDDSLSKRPMKRIIAPLELMGAKIKSNDNKLPLEIEGTKLKAITYHSPISSAQVKSALILAGLGIDEPTRIYEKTLSRNHSEIMLSYLEADIKIGQDDKGHFVEVKKSKLIPKDIEIAGDISSAAFFMVAAAIVPNSDITIKNVGINPTRTGILDVFKQAEIDFSIINERLVSSELVADIRVKYTKNIKPFEIKGDLIPRLIDEIPILAILAAKAQGISTVSDAQDLRNKESDRIKTIVEALSFLGIDIKEKPDGFNIKGCDEINKTAILETHLDHRLAMSFYVLSMINNQAMKIKGFDCINTSFPEFLKLIKELKS